eukprot:GHVQ01033734.1.p1 GENE.GHVQ01033734.1~~GHVQ01033734.1.p1  ORF type:complete len:187 (+),score=16.30 GHVQ01033734.1:259-819(+)
MYVDHPSSSILFPKVVSRVLRHRAGCETQDEAASRPHVSETFLPGMTPDSRIKEFWDRPWHPADEDFVIKETFNWNTSRIANAGEDLYRQLVKTQSTMSFEQAAKNLKALVPQLTKTIMLEVNIETLKIDCHLDQHPLADADANKSYEERLSSEVERVLHHAVKLVTLALRYFTDEFREIQWTAKR